MIDILVKGGVFMYPIILCSIIALAVFLERLWVLRRRQILPAEFIRKIEELLKKEKLSEALFLCQGDTSSIARIFLAGLKNAGRGMWLVKESVEERGGPVPLEEVPQCLGEVQNIAVNFHQLRGLCTDLAGEANDGAVVVDDVI